MIQMQQSELEQTFRFGEVIKLAHHTVFKNIQQQDTVIHWLQNKFGKKTPLIVGMNKDGTISELDIGLKLTKAEKKSITDKFPELEGKEIED